MCVVEVRCLRPQDAGRGSLADPLRVAGNARRRARRARDRGHARVRDSPPEAPSALRHGWGGSPSPRGSSRRGDWARRAPFAAPRSSGAHGGHPRRTRPTRRRLLREISRRSLLTPLPRPHPCACALLGAAHVTSAMCACASSRRTFSSPLGLPVIVPPTDHRVDASLDRRRHRVGVGHHAPRDPRRVRLEPATMGGVDGGWGEDE